MGSRGAEATMEFGRPRVSVKNEPVWRVDAPVGD